MRRTLGSRARAWLLLALVGHAFGCGEGGAPPSEVDRQPVFGVQLHVHGSMSEGPASMEAHTHAARALGGAADVIWWTDHDWRIAGHTYVERFDFESGLIDTEPAPVPLKMTQMDGREPLPAWAGADQFGPDAEPERIERVRKGFAVRQQPGRRAAPRLRTTDRERRRGRQSLHFALRGHDGGREVLDLAFVASRRRQIASLASEVTLRLSILPARVEGDAEVVVWVDLSQRRPGERSRIEYVLEPAERADGRPRYEAVSRFESQRSGKVLRVARVPVPSAFGVWNDWALDLTTAARRLDLGGEDNAVVDWGVRVEVGADAWVDGYLDAIDIERRRLGAPLLDRQREMADALADEAIAHHVGQEISYAAHLNAFGANVPLTDYGRRPHGLTPEEAVEWVHAHGGLVSLNHLFGISEARFPRSEEAFEASLARLVERRAYGADLLEVGYRVRGHGLPAFLELWDGLARAGVRLVGVGVSDSHDAEVGWQNGPNNFLTWVYADSASEDDLLAGLRAGRVFFGDPTRFDGRLDIESGSGARMGQVVRVAPGPQTVTFVAEGLRPGQWLRVVRDGQPLEVQDEGVESAPGQRALTLSLPVDQSTFVRFEVVGPHGPVALSNPLYFDVEASARGPGASR